MDCCWPLDVEACCKRSSLDLTVPEDAAKAHQIIRQVSVMLSTWSGFRFGGCKTIRPSEPCGSCRPRSCIQGDCIILHDASSVVEVRVDGDPVEGWTFDPVRGILCSDEGWPTTSLGDIPTLEVDVMIGEEPDAWALAVGNEIACELIKACVGDKSCRLPRNATTVTSQGVTVALSLDEITYIMPSVIQWVRAINPVRATRPARVLSPEANRAKVVGR